MVVSDLLYTSLRLAGILHAAGRTASTSVMLDAFNSLNALVDAWNAEQLSVYAIERRTFTLTIGVGTYTIGIGGALNTPRPIKIERANGVIGNPEVNPEIEIITAEDWAEMPFKVDSSLFGPTKLFYQSSYPLGTIYFTPAPAGPASVHLYVWAQFTQFALQAEVLALPPAYLRALEYNLAVELSAHPQFRRFPMDPTVAKMAAEFKNAIRELNAQVQYGISPISQAAESAESSEPRSHAA